MATIRIELHTSVSAAARKEGIIDAKPLLKKIFTLDWKWYKVKINASLGSGKIPFRVQPDDPFGVAQFEDGFVYRYCGMDEYVFYSTEDARKRWKAISLKIDANGAAIYEACRRFARSSNPSYLDEIAKLDAQGLVPKIWKIAPAGKVYRGIRLSKALLKKFNAQGTLQLKSKNRYSSWSAKKKIAEGFLDYETGILLHRKISAKDILIYIPAMLKSFGIPGSRWDFDDEGELVVKDTVDNLRIEQKYVAHIELG